MFYMLINCDNYTEQIEKDITKALPKGVKHHFQSVYGVYDAVVKIEGSDDTDTKQNAGHVSDDSKQNARAISEKILSLSKIYSVAVLSVVE